MKEYLPIVLEFLEGAEEFKPVFSKSIETLKIFSPELVEVLNGIFDYSVDTKARMVKRFIERHGFSLEDAIFMTSDMLSNLAKKQYKSGK